MLYCSTLEKSLQKLTPQQLKHAKRLIDRIVYCGTMGVLSSDWPDLDVTIAEKSCETEPIKDRMKDLDACNDVIPSFSKRLKIDTHNKYADEILSSVHDEEEHISDEPEEFVIEKEEDVASDMGDRYKLHGTVYNVDFAVDDEVVTAKVIDYQKLTIMPLYEHTDNISDSEEHMPNGLPATRSRLESEAINASMSEEITTSDGCIGGTQIRIDKPVEDAERYLLRKGYYAIQLQAIIDENLRFVDVFVEYPGEPELIEYIREICGEPYCLLGGTAYPCLRQLLVPYRKATTAAQKAFNERLQMVLVGHYNIFIRLKQRFRQLFHLKGRNMHSVVKLIKVCCILHNLAAPDELERIALKADEHREEAIASAPVFIYAFKDESQSEIFNGQRKRDIICASNCT
uniref:DDE Tnp4 domain-containing protein n=1 Tax=Anopheles farauti TaxID=69004 RepID=A0A182QKG1_9DIPT